MQRIGIFATLHGDEPEGVLALGKFLQTLEERPEIAEGGTFDVITRKN